MVNESRKNWFFVLHLEARDRPSTGKRFEIQLLNIYGEAVECGYIDDDDDSLQIGEHPVPLLVIEAARKQPLGKGDYVDEAGQSVSPF